MSDVATCAIRGKKLINSFATQEHHETRLRLGSTDDWIDLGAVVYVGEEMAGLKGMGEALLHVINTAFSMGYEARKAEENDNDTLP